MASRFAVIPANAGIQCLGVDSGSPFHSARNDGGGVVGPRSLSAHSHEWEAGSPSSPRTRESSASAWIPGLRFTAPGMTGSGAVGIRSLPAYSYGREAGSPSFPRKRESNTSAWIPGLRFTPTGMMGSVLIVSFFALCRRHAHGWRPAGFDPLPRGRVPFCLQQQKGTKKCRPSHPAFSCASRPGRGVG